MPSIQKSRALERTRQRERRGRIILLGILILIILIGVGWYVYASTQTGNQNTSTSGTYAKLNTSTGLIELQLYPNSAPKTVANFVNLANTHFYDNLVWHRIVRTSPVVIQTGDSNTRNYGGGDRSTWGMGGSSQTVPYEPDSSLHNTAGYVAMAHLPNDVNSGTSQFYINLADNSYLDGQYTIFAKVISGMDVANTILQVPTNSLDQPVNPVYLTSVTVSNNP